MPTGHYEHKSRLWTAEMDEFIRENYPKMGSKKLVPLMREKFHYDFTSFSLQNRAHKLGIHVDSSSSWHTRGLTDTYNSMPLGSERDSGRYMYVKVSTGHSGYGNWKQKHRIVWEEANGPIPKDHIIIFLDRDYHNCELSNLRCIPRKYVAFMTDSSFNWFNGGPQMIEAGIAWCDLHYAIKEAMEGQ